MKLLVGWLNFITENKSRWMAFQTGNSCLSVLVAMAGVTGQAVLQCQVLNRFLSTSLLPTLNLAQTL